MAIFKINMKLKNIKKYIRLYDIEYTLFNIIGPAVKKRGYLTFYDFYKICMWKTRRAKNRYLKNQNCVEQIAKLAFLEKDENKKMKILCQFDGVSVPVASAILTIVYPEEYGIIDIRCLEMLNTLGFEISKHPNIKTWLKFIKIMRKLAKENEITPRKVDMVLFAMHKEMLDKDNYRSLYNSQ
jgi:thermostable 8-oxoguanine DNA glycosylase